MKGFLAMALAMVPVSTILGAIGFLGERPDAHVLIGGLIVIGGVGAVIVEPSEIRKLWKPRDRYRGSSMIPSARSESMRLSFIDNRSRNTSRLCAPSRGGGMLAFGGVAASLSGLAMPGTLPVRSSAICMLNPR